MHIEMLLHYCNILRGENNNTILNVYYIMFHNLNYINDK